MTTLNSGDDWIEPYAAGLVDGEGSIGLYKLNKPNNRQQGWQLVLRIGMTDIGPVKLLQDSFGGVLFTHQPKGLGATRKLVYHYHIAGRKCQALLRILLPYLQGKRKQAELALLAPIGIPGCKSSPEDHLLYESIYQDLKEAKLG